MKSPAVERSIPTALDFAKTLARVSRSPAQCAASRLRVDKTFCRSCGASMSGHPTRFASPKSYTPRYLAERILTSRSALEVCFQPICPTAKRCKIFELG